MEYFIKQISNPYWWLSVFFVGIIINLISSYLRTFIDKYFPKLYDKFFNIFSNAKKRQEKLIIELVNNQELVNQLFQEETRARLKAIGFLIASITMVGTALFFSLHGDSDVKQIAKYFLYLGIIFSGLSGYVSGESSGTARLLIKADKLRKQKNKSG